MHQWLSVSQAAFFHNQNSEEGMPPFVGSDEPRFFPTMINEAHF